jgi:hypothetical protein
MLIPLQVMLMPVMQFAMVVALFARLALIWMMTFWIAAALKISGPSVIVTVEAPVVKMLVVPVVMMASVTPLIVPALPIVRVPVVELNDVSALVRMSPGAGYVVVLLLSNSMRPGTG